MKHKEPHPPSALQQGKPIWLPVLTEKGKNAEENIYVKYAPCRRAARGTVTITLAPGWAKQRQGGRGAVLAVAQREWQEAAGMSSDSLRGLSW